MRYAAPLYVDMTQEDETGRKEEFPKVLIGRVPIMLRSSYCVLGGLKDTELAELGECPYDQVTLFLYSFIEIL